MLTTQALMISLSLTVMFVLSCFFFKKASGDVFYYSAGLHEKCSMSRVRVGNINKYRIIKRYILSGLISPCQALYSSPMISI